jgi:hypothetical protein
MVGFQIGTEMARPRDQATAELEALGVVVY